LARKLRICEGTVSARLALFLRNTEVGGRKAKARDCQIFVGCQKASRETSEMRDDIWSPSPSMNFYCKVPTYARCAAEIACFEGRFTPFIAGSISRPSGWLRGVYLYLLVTGGLPS
jgi:hypothetical protein